MSRPVLTLRDPGVERLLAHLPPYAAPDSLDDTRRWGCALMRSASRWQLDKRRRNALARNGGSNDG